MKEQLLAALPEEVSIWGWRRRSLRPAGKLDDDYLQAHSTIAKPPQQSEKQPQKLTNCFSCNWKGQQFIQFPSTSSLYCDAIGDGFGGCVKDKMPSSILQVLSMTSAVRFCWTQEQHRAWFTNISLLMMTFTMSKRFSVLMEIL